MWKLHRKYKSLEVTPQGQYFMKYIIDFYINETIDEPTDRYEQQIFELSRRIQLPRTKEKIPEELQPLFLHYHTAIIMLRSFLMMVPNKQEWLDTIIDEGIRQKIATPIYIID